MYLFFFQRKSLSSLHQYKNHREISVKQIEKNQYCSTENSTLSIPSLEFNSQNNLENQLQENNSVKIAIYDSENLFSKTSSLNSTFFWQEKQSLYQKNKIIFLKMINKGAYGRIFLAQSKDTQDLLAIKVINLVKSSI